MLTTHTEKSTACIIVPASSSVTKLWIRSWSYGGVVTRIINLSNNSAERFIPWLVNLPWGKAVSTQHSSRPMNKKPDGPMDGLDVLEKEKYLAPARNQPQFLDHRTLNLPLRYHGSTPCSKTSTQARKGGHVHTVGGVPLFLWCTRYL